METISHPYYWGFDLEENGNLIFKFSIANHVCETTYLYTIHPNALKKFILQDFEVFTFPKNEKIIWFLEDDELKCVLMKDGVIKFGIIKWHPSGEDDLMKYNMEDYFEQDEEGFTEEDLIS